LKGIQNIRVKFVYYLIDCSIKNYICVVNDILFHLTNNFLN